MMRAKLISSRLSLLTKAVQGTPSHSPKICGRNRRMNDIKLHHLSSASESTFSAQDPQEFKIDDLFCPSEINTILNKSASVKRTFSPQCNAQAMLTCGGSVLAKHASFDPHYGRAKNYIRNHAVGPAVLSPVLVNGLVGALVEATLPQSFLISVEMKQHRPLIVGVQVEASIKVASVKEYKIDETETSKTSYQYQQHGHELVLQTEVRIVSDGALISEGSQHIWLPQDV